MSIHRTAMIDDDGSGMTGTILNNAWKTELYDQIDGVAPDRVLAAATGTDTSPGVGILASLPIAAGQLGPFDALVIEASIQIAGPMTPPLSVDLYGSGVPNSGALISLSGSLAAGDLVAGVVGNFRAVVRRLPSTPVVFHTLASGVVTLDLPQFLGASFGRIVPVDQWDTAWTLHFRQISGVPAGTVVYWTWTVRQCAGRIM